MGSEMCIRDSYLIIKKALQAACPQGKVKERNSNNPWWTKQLQEHRTALNKLYCARKNSEEDWKIFKDAEKRYKRACGKAKKNDWVGFVEEQQTVDSINKLRKILEANVKHTLGVLQKEDGTHTEPGKETLQFLLKSHFPSIQETLPTKYKDTVIPAKDVYALELKWLTVEKLKEVFKPVSYTHLTLPTTPYV